jgi:hypothetical protein
MDGPTIPWTVADLFVSPPKLAMVYHVSSAGYSVFNPTGSLLGGVLALGSMARGGTGPYTPLIANGGLVGGALGITLGLAGLYSKARQGEALEPLPWNDDGIQMRVNGLQHNYKVRTLDLSVWTGVAVATALYAVRPKILSPLSLLQVVSLGSTLGSLSGMAFIANSERNAKLLLRKAWIDTIIVRYLGIISISKAI